LPFKCNLQRYTKGQASISPYATPFNCRVFPANFDLRMSELYYWDPTAADLTARWGSAG
jgi:hypothetical protein